MAPLSARDKLALGAGVVMLALAAVLLISRAATRPSRAAAVPANRVQPPGKDPSLLLAERTIGDSMAPVTIWEFSDFQCPYCRDFWREVLPRLEREYLRPGKARLIYINYPLTSIHPNALLAHEYATCVARDKRFRPYHDLLYRHQDTWAPMRDPTGYFRGLVDSVGLSPQLIATCVDTHALSWLVMGEQEAARKAGINSTPSFVVDGVLYKGAFGIEEWRPILDSIYAARLSGSGNQQ